MSGTGGSNVLIWLVGRAGAGKTTIIKELERIIDCKVFDGKEPISSSVLPRVAASAYGIPTEDAHVILVDTHYEVCAKRREGRENPNVLIPPYIPGNPDLVVDGTAEPVRNARVIAKYINDIK